MKKSALLVLASGMLLASCSSAFKTGQTPDDVYYSYGASLPAREDRQQEETSDEAYKSYWNGANDDAYLRMKVRDRDRWSAIDDVNYWYGYNNPRNMWNSNWVSFNSWNSWGWGVGFNTWSNPWAFNSYYNSWSNPWCWNRPVVVINKYPTTVTSGRPNLNYTGFSNSLFDRGGTSNGYSGKTYQSSESGSLFRSIFRSSGGSGTSTGDVISRPGRLFSESSSSGGSSFGGGSSSGSSRSSGGGGSSSGSGGSRGGRGGN